MFYHEMTPNERDRAYRGRAYGYEAYSKPISQEPAIFSASEQAAHDEMVRQAKTLLASVLGDAVEAKQERQADFLEQVA